VLPSNLLHVLVTDYCSPSIKRVDAYVCGAVAV